MKQMLLVAMIHLLILHQYQKDKKEALAPKKESSAKTLESKNYLEARLKGVQPYTNDSLHFSTYHRYSYSPVAYQETYRQESSR